MAIKKPESLEQRVREGASGFEFNALMNNAEQPGVENPADVMQRRFESYLDAPNTEAVVHPYGNEPIPLETSRHPLDRKSNSALLVTSALAALALGGWALYLSQTPAEKPGPTSNPSSSTTAAVISEPKPEPKVGLPKPELTPGERSPKPTVGVAIPEQVRTEVFKAYGIPAGDTLRVPVRLIPAEFGGTNGPKNVFPLTPWFAGLKARLDAFLIDQVRSGKMTPAQAEAELTSNWVRSCHIHYIRNYGETDAEKARKTEDQLRWE